MHLFDVLGRLKQREMIKSKVFRGAGTGNTVSTVIMFPPNSATYYKNHHTIDQLMWVCISR